MMRLEIQRVNEIIMIFQESHLKSVRSRYKAHNRHIKKQF